MKATSMMKLEGLAVAFAIASSGTQKKTVKENSPKAPLSLLNILHLQRSHQTT